MAIWRRRVCVLLKELKLKMEMEMEWCCRKRDGDDGGGWNWESRVSRSAAVCVSLFAIVPAGRSITCPLSLDSISAWRDFSPASSLAPKVQTGLLVIADNE